MNNFVSRRVDPAPLDKEGLTLLHHSISMLDFFVLVNFHKVWFFAFSCYKKLNFFSSGIVSILGVDCEGLISECKILRNLGGSLFFIYQNYFL